MRAADGEILPCALSAVGVEATHFEIRGCEPINCDWLQENYDLWK